MTTDAEKIEYYRARLKRLASSKPFDVSSGPTCHESNKRMNYAAEALKGPQVSAFEERWNVAKGTSLPGSYTEHKNTHNSAINAAIDSLPAGIPGKWLTDLREE